MSSMNSALSILHASVWLACDRRPRSTSKRWFWNSTLLVTPSSAPASATLSFSGLARPQPSIRLWIAVLSSCRSLTSFLVSFRSLTIWCCSWASVRSWWWLLSSCTFAVIACSKCAEAVVDLYRMPLKRSSNQAPVSPERLEMVSVMLFSSSADMSSKLSTSSCDRVPLDRLLAFTRRSSASSQSLAEISPSFSARCFLITFSWTSAFWSSFFIWAISLASIFSSFWKSFIAIRSRVSSRCCSLASSRAAFSLSVSSILSIFFMNLSYAASFRLSVSWSLFTRWATSLTVASNSWLMELRTPCSFSCLANSLWASACAWESTASIWRRVILVSSSCWALSNCSRASLAASSATATAPPNQSLAWACRAAASARERHASLDWPAFAELRSVCPRARSRARSGSMERPLQPTRTRKSTRGRWIIAAEKVSG
mmetsp:Transcript_117976/g.320172  ORF Transcript_117976/g.320172 Transcript_117976/m.320172 type:complete len:429 (+) Transcript_117976:390-1676(+)